MKYIKDITKFIIIVAAGVALMFLIESCAADNTKQTSMSLSHGYDRVDVETIDGHEYLILRSHNGRGITHSESCDAYHD